MRTLTSSLYRTCGSVALILCAGSAAFASDLVLQKVPQVAIPEPAAGSQTGLGPQATFALVNYNVAGSQGKAHALYVSSGTDLSVANNLVDNQTATSFGFSADDKSPTAIIDLGKLCTLKHLTATYSAQPGSMDFYVMKSLPANGQDAAQASLQIDANAISTLEPIASSVDDGTQGKSSVDIAPTEGRYLMVRWNPATQTSGDFTLAEVSAFNPEGGNLYASNVNFANPTTNTERSERKVATDSKDVPDAKDIVDTKDIPEEGPGLPPPLPLTPSFTFIPQLVPASK